MNKEITIRVFNELLAELGLNPNELAGKIGMSRAQGLYDILNPNKENVGISKKMADKICTEFPQIDKKYLLTGTGSILIKGQSVPARGVPYWNLPVSAGRSIADVIGASKPDGFISGLPGVDIAENILPVTGTSMEPEISPGAIIGVRLMNNYDTLNTERIYLIITNDDRMIKRVEHDRENEDILWCVSPNYPRFKIYKNDIIEIHRVCFVYNPK